MLRVTLFLRPPDRQSALAANSTTHRRLMPSKAPSVTGGVSNSPSHTMNRFSVVPSVTRPAPFNNTASSASAQFASTRARMLLRLRLLIRGSSPSAGSLRVFAMMRLHPPYLRTDQTELVGNNEHTRARTTTRIETHRASATSNYQTQVTICL